jgi:hypothetical protein
MVHVVAEATTYKDHPSRCRFSRVGLTLAAPPVRSCRRQGLRVKRRWLRGRIVVRRRCNEKTGTACRAPTVGVGGNVRANWAARRGADAGREIYVPRGDGALGREKAKRDPSLRSLRKITQGRQDDVKNANREIGVPRNGPRATDLRRGARLPFPTSGTGGRALLFVGVKTRRLVRETIGTSLRHRANGPRRFFTCSSSTGCGAGGRGAWRSQLLRCRHRRRGAASNAALRFPRRTYPWRRRWEKRR